MTATVAALSHGMTLFHNFGPQNVSTLDSTSQTVKPERLLSDYWWGPQCTQAGRRVHPSPLLRRQRPHATVPTRSGYAAEDRRALDGEDVVRADCAES